MPTKALIRARTQSLAFVKDYAITFPVLFDEGGPLARWLRPTHMPEAFVLKPDGAVLYHGRIDDWYESPGKPRARAQQHFPVRRAGRVRERRRHRD